MGVGSAKRASARSQHQQHLTPVKARRSASVSQSIKVDTRTPTPRSARKPKSAQAFSSRLPTDQQRRSNGRVSGRSLIVWGRPRMAEKLLLHLQYECARHKSQVPWDAIAHRLHPGSSGAAVVQHLGRLRRELIAEGHMVPPIPSRPGAKDDAEVRGYVRQYEDGSDKETCRPVRFDERMDDRKMNLPDAYIDEADEDGDDEEQSGDNSFAYGRSDFEDDGDLPESPTPAGRRARPIIPPAHRAANMPPRFDPYGGNMYPAPPGSDEAEDEKFPVDQSLLESDASMYNSTQTSRTRDADTDEHHAPGHNLADSSAGMYQSPGIHRPFLGNERPHPVHAYGDPFEGSGPYARPEAAGMPMARSAFDYYHHPGPYGFPHPWSMGYSMPPPGFCYQPVGSDRVAERASDEAAGNSTPSPPQKAPKTEPSHAETLSTSQSSDPQLEDLLNEQGVEAVGALEPAQNGHS